MTSAVDVPGEPFGHPICLRAQRSKPITSEFVDVARTRCHANAVRDWRSTPIRPELIAIARRRMCGNLGVELREQSTRSTTTSISLSVSISWAPFRLPKAVKLHTLLDLRGKFTFIHIVMANA